MCVFRLPTLSVLLQSCLKRGSETEITLACHSVELICLSVGSDGDSLYSSVRATLRRIAKHGESSAPAIRALGLLSFMSCHDDQDALEALPLFVKFMKMKNAAVAAAALDAWGLVATCLTSHRLNAMSEKYVYVGITSYQMTCSS